MRGRKHNPSLIFIFPNLIRFVCNYMSLESSFKSNLKVSKKTLQVDLDELNTPPAPHKNIKLIFKGLYAPVIIPDFPIQERTILPRLRKGK